MKLHIKNSVTHLFLPFSTFIEYQKKLRELKAALHVKKFSITEARKLLDAYIKPSQKLSDDILNMREE